MIYCVKDKVKNQSEGLTVTMMTCPKCGFEQPKDQFCAKCGVNVESFKAPVALGSSLKSFFKPVLFIAILIGAIYFLFRTVENTVSIPEITEIEETTQMGVGAGSLKTERPPPPTAENFRQQQAQAPQQVTAQRAAPVAATAVVPTARFNQVQLTFMVGEHAGLDQLDDNDTKPNQTWHLVPQSNPIYTSSPEVVTLRTGNNTFEYADSLITYDMNFFIEEITDKDLKVKINLNRVLRARTAGGQPNYSISLDERIPFDRTLIIIDALPRRASLEVSDSILSTLYRSQAFLSQASEFVQIIKFENPSNSPQE